MGSKKKEGRGRETVGEVWKRMVGSVKERKEEREEKKVSFSKLGDIKKDSEGSLLDLTLPPLSKLLSFATFQW
jgi:hypothetical protein